MFKIFFITAVAMTFPAMSFSCLWEPFDGSVKDAAQEIMEADIVAKVTILNKSDIGPDQDNPRKITRYEIKVLTDFKGAEGVKEIYTMAHSCAFYASVGEQHLIRGQHRDNKIFVNEMRPFPFRIEKVLDLLESGDI